jgi:hypothetical protein
MQIDAAVAVILAASIAGFFSTVTAIVVIIYTKRSEERRHFRELIVRTAIENWKLADEAARQARADRWPLDVYIIHMLKFSEIITKKNLTPEELSRHNNELRALVDRAMSIAEIASGRTEGTRAALELLERIGDNTLTGVGGCRYGN